VGGIPTIFCAATETSRDIATEYIKTTISSLPHHKFEYYVMDAPEYADLLETAIDSKGFGYMVEVYVSDFMSLV
jgi:hypothetical protein